LTAGGQRIALRKAGVLRYLFNDHLGSTSVTSDAAGNSVAELRYRAFGQTRFALGSTPTSLRFTGQMQAPELGLYWYGTRLYDPALGRWIQPDSVVPDKGNPQGLDRYAYVANSPVTRTDVSGHCWGIASGIRGLPSYGTTCDNLDKALTVVQSEQTTLDQKVLAGSYIAAEGTAHAALAAGTGLLAGIYSFQTVEAIIGIGEAACADGDCKNDFIAATKVIDAAQTGIDRVERVVNSFGNQVFEKGVNIKVPGVGSTDFDVLLTGNRYIEVGGPEKGMTPDAFSHFGRQLQVLSEYAKINSG
jgi:RHS repeat-associated protein